jgi:hypothetical protein
VISELPNVDGPVLAYLDVWERIVTAGDDAGLIVPSLDIETCARTKREWVVRTRPGTSVPRPGNDEFIQGHSYAGLATISRQNASSSISITDVRTTALAALPPTLVPDVFGQTTSDYALGTNRPPISLRDAINSYIRGDQVLGTETANAFANIGTTSALAFDLTGGLIAALANQGQIIAGRLDPANASAGFVFPPQSPVTSGTKHDSPHVAVLPTGDILVVYNTTDVPSSEDVFFSRASSVGSFDGGGGTPVATTPGVSEINPFAFVSPMAIGGRVVFFWHSASGGPSGGATWMFRRRLYTDEHWLEGGASWMESAGVPIPSTLPAIAPTAIHATIGLNGLIYGAYTATLGSQGGPVPFIQPFAINPASGQALPAGSPIVETAPAGGADRAINSPFVVTDAHGAIRVFFTSAAGISQLNYPSTSALVTPPGTDLVPGTTPGSSVPTAALDGQNGLWLFWGTDTFDIATARLNLTTGTWGAVRRVTDKVAVTTGPSTISFNSNSSPFVIRSPTGVLWLFWQNSGGVTSTVPGGQGGGGAGVSFRQIFTAI